MKRLLFTVALLSAFPCFAQDEFPYISPEMVNDGYSGIDTMYLNDTIFIAEGAELAMGRGSMVDGDYQHILIAVDELRSTRTDYAVNALSRKYSGKSFKVLSVERRGSRRTGYVHFVVIRVAGIRYDVDIMNALISGEVVVPGYDVPEQPLSIADELKKFAELKESGVITEQEFEQQKRKLLSK